MSETAKKWTVACVTAIGMWAFIGCGKKDKGDESDELPSVSRAEPAAVGVLATVNGVPITEDDVLLKNTGARNATLPPLRKKAILETLIREELVRQAAVEAGLDEDEEYAAEHRKMKARLTAFERSKLGQLYYRKEVLAKAVPSEEQARKFFDANKARIETELHVWQILSRSRPDIEAALADIEAGKPFEEVARKRFPKIPPGQLPWDLGFLKWKQIPKPWRDHVYSLEPGGTTKIIEGPKSRFWIVKLVEKRTDAGVTFENQKQFILDELKSGTVAELRKTAIDGLRKKAKIEYIGPSEPDPHE